MMLASSVLPLQHLNTDTVQQQHISQIYEANASSASCSALSNTRFKYIRKKVQSNGLVNLETAASPVSEMLQARTVAGDPAESNKATVNTSKVFKQIMMLYDEDGLSQEQLPSAIPAMRSADAMAAGAVEANTASNGIHLSAHEEMTIPDIDKPIMIEQYNKQLSRYQVQNQNNGAHLYYFMTNVPKQVRDNFDQRNQFVRNWAEIQEKAGSQQFKFKAKKKNAMTMEAAAGDAIEGKEQMKVQRQGPKILVEVNPFKQREQENGEAMQVHVVNEQKTEDNEQVNRESDQKQLGDNLKDSSSSIDSLDSKELKLKEEMLMVKLEQLRLLKRKRLQCGAKVETSDRHIAFSDNIRPRTQQESDYIDVKIVPQGQNVHQIKQIRRFSHDDNGDERQQVVLSSSTSQGQPAQGGFGNQRAESQNNNPDQNQINVPNLTQAARKDSLYGVGQQSKNLEKKHFSELEHWQTDYAFGNKQMEKRGFPKANNRNTQNQRGVSNQTQFDIKDIHKSRVKSAAIVSSKSNQMVPVRNSASGFSHGQRGAEALNGNHDAVLVKESDPDLSDHQVAVPFEPSAILYGQSHQIYYSPGKYGSTSTSQIMQQDPKSGGGGRRAIIQNFSYDDIGGDISSMQRIPSSQNMYSSTSVGYGQTDGNIMSHKLISSDQQAPRVSNNRMVIADKTSGEQQQKNLHRQMMPGYEVVQHLPQDRMMMVDSNDNRSYLAALRQCRDYIRQTKNHTTNANRRINASNSPSGYAKSSAGPRQGRHAKRGISSSVLLSATGAGGPGVRGPVSGAVKVLAEVKTPGQLNSRNPATKQGSQGTSMLHQFDNCIVDHSGYNHSTNPQAPTKKEASDQLLLCGNCGDPKEMAASFSKALIHNTNQRRKINRILNIHKWAQNNQSSKSRSSAIAHSTTNAGVLQKFKNTYCSVQQSSVLDSQRPKSSNAGRFKSRKSQSKSKLLLNTQYDQSAAPSFPNSKATSAEVTAQAAGDKGVRNLNQQQTNTASNLESGNLKSPGAIEEHRKDAGQAQDGSKQLQSRLTEQRVNSQQGPTPGAVPEQHLPGFIGDPHMSSKISQRQKQQTDKPQTHFKSNSTNTLKSRNKSACAGASQTSLARSAFLQQSGIVKNVQQLNRSLMRQEQQQYDDLKRKTFNLIAGKPQTKEPKNQSFVDYNQHSQMLPNYIISAADDQKSDLEHIDLRDVANSRSPKPKARISRYCHSKLDEMSCESFLNFIRRYDESTTKLIIKEALVPDISDAQHQRQWGSRRALKSALDSWGNDSNESSLMKMLPAGMVKAARGERSGVLMRSSKTRNQYNHTAKLQNQSDIQKVQQKPRALQNAWMKPPKSSSSSPAREHHRTKLPKDPAAHEASKKTDIGSHELVEAVQGLEDKNASRKLPEPSFFNLNLSEDNKINRIKAQEKPIKSPDPPNEVKKGKNDLNFN